MAVTSAYLPLWFADRGLTASEIGQVLGFGSVLRVIVVPGWGWVADRLGRRRLVLFAAAGSAAAAAALLPAGQGFAAILVISAFQGVSAAALTPLSDSLTLALAAARRLDYGRTRAYGSVAYMAATTAAGMTLQQSGTWLVPWALALGYSIAAALTPALPHLEPPPKARRTPVGLFGNRQFRLTVLATALIQGAHAAYYAFAPLHWRAAGIPNGTIGLLIAEGIVAEVVLFVWGRTLVERLGPARLTALAAAASVLRWTATAFVTDVPALALIQPLHAMTFAFQHLSAMLVLRAMPSNQAGQAQTVLSAIGFAALTGLLVWLSGQIYGVAPGATFLVMAAVGGAGLFVAAAMARTPSARAQGCPTVP